MWFLFENGPGKFKTFRILEFSAKTVLKWIQSKFSDSNFWPGKIFQRAVYPNRVFSQFPRVFYLFLVLKSPFLVNLRHQYWFYYNKGVKCVCPFLTPLGIMGQPPVSIILIFIISLYFRCFSSDFDLRQFSKFSIFFGDIFWNFFSCEFFLFFWDFEKCRGRGWRRGRIWNGQEDALSTSFNHCTTRLTSFAIMTMVKCPYGSYESIAHRTNVPTKTYIGSST